jgi:hypothetical protein
MKMFLVLSFTFYAAVSGAHIEFSGDDPPKATMKEVISSRSCFEELKIQGCGDPGEDISHFRNCLKETREVLSEKCQKMMEDLYHEK